MSHVPTETFHHLRDTAKKLAAFFEVLETMPEQCHHDILKHCLSITTELYVGVCLFVDPNGVLRHASLESSDV